MDPAPAGRRPLGIDDGRGLSPIRGSAITGGLADPGLAPGATICRPYGTYRRDAKHILGQGSTYSGVASRVGRGPDPAVIF